MKQYTENSPNGKIWKNRPRRGSLSFLCHWTFPSACLSSAPLLFSLSLCVSKQHAFPLWAVVPSKSCCAATSSTQAWNLSPLCQQMLQTERRTSVGLAKIYKSKQRKRDTCEKQVILKLRKRKTNIEEYSQHTTNEQMQPWCCQINIKGLFWSCKGFVENL